AQPYTAGGPGQVGKRRDHIEIAASRAFGLIGRDTEMVGDEKRVEPRIFRDSCARAKRRAIGLRTHVAKGDAVFHVEPFRAAERLGAVLRAITTQSNSRKPIEA